MIWVVLAAGMLGAVLIRAELRRISSTRALLGLLVAEQTAQAERLFSIDGIVGRLVPELQWAELTGRRVAVVVVRWYATPDEVGANAVTLAQLTRAHECVFRTDRREIAIALSAAHDLEVLHAVRRLISMTIEQRGRQVCDVGCAVFPIDATDIDGLFDAARARLRPWQDWIDAAQRAPWVAAAT